jgi:hypothetical protein
MVFVFELEDETHPAQHLPDSLSPVQRAWLLKSVTSGGGVPQHDEAVLGRQDRPHDQSSRQDEEVQKSGYEDVEEDGVVALNMNSFSACLCCYPYVSQVCSSYIYIRPFDTVSLLP